MITSKDYQSASVIAQEAIEKGYSEEYILNNCDERIIEEYKRKTNPSHDMACRDAYYLMQFEED